MQYPAVWHSDLIFYLLTKFLLPRAAINCRRGVDFSKLIAHSRALIGKMHRTILTAGSTAILHPQLRVSAG